MNMAPKSIFLISITLLVFLPLLSNLVLARPNYKIDTPTTSSPFEFLGHLKGCHKGDHLKDIKKLKTYLQKFGYFNEYNTTNASSRSNINDDEFDDLVESAIKTYQLNYHLNTTGYLDSQTVSKMMMPRCGVADIINGTTRMTSGDHSRTTHHGIKSLHTVSHYSFFQGNPKWPPSKYRLTFAFGQGVPTKAINPVLRAFRTWQAYTHFSFRMIQNSAAADIIVSFNRADHGDGNPFDGPGGILAHAFAPEVGWCHFDGAESWSVGAVQGSYDLFTVALHEIGHLLGLGHSSVAGAIMFPSIASGVTKGLHRDDIEGIKALYNV